MRELWLWEAMGRDVGDEVVQRMRRGFHRCKTRDGVAAAEHANRVGVEGEVLLSFK